MKEATILDMPSVLSILETVEDGLDMSLYAAVKVCKYTYLSDSGDSLVICYEGQPGVFHVHILAKPRRGLEAIKLLEEVIVELFSKYNATLVLGVTGAKHKGWKRLLKFKRGEDLNYIDLPDDTRMYYFTTEDYKRRGEPWV